jgi:hypothetical protein
MMARLTFTDLALSYHFKMFLWHNKQSLEHAKKRTEIFMKKHPQMLQKQNGLNIEKSFIDDMHFPNAYKKQEDKQ